MNDPLWQKIKSAAAELAWPPLTRGPAATLELLARQLEATQWLAQNEIEQRQCAQLEKLAHHAMQHSPFFAARMKTAGLRASALCVRENLARLPLLTRRDLQRGTDVYCTQVPADHQPVREARTSGSTGEPVVVRRTSISQLFWLAITLREFFWHERAFDLRFSAVRPSFPAHVIRQDWGAPASLLFETGPSQLIPITTDIAQLAAWLAEFSPHVLIVYPNVLEGLIAHFGKDAAALPDLKLIRSISETLSPRLREEARAFFGARVVDNYSSQEAGVIAVQCPDADIYHIMSESLIVEVVDERGRACAQGETGRVVLTDLHNFATPLIRYDIGDYAERGGVCSCGRGLPTLKRVLGRARHLILMPDGTRHWPLVGFARFRDVAPVAQYQLIQTGREEIEVRLVVETPLSAAQKSDLCAVIRETLGFAFALSFVYFETKIPRGPRGKFEEFVCKV